MKKKILIVILLAVIFLAAAKFGIFSKLTGKTSGDVSCADSDGRAAYYTKGKTTGQASLTSETKNYYDHCYNTTDSEVDNCEGYGCTVYEYFCGFRGLVNYGIALCPNGCKNGACIREQDKNEREQNETSENEQEQSENEPEESESEQEQTEKTDISDDKEKSSSLPARSITKEILDFFKNIFGK